jgi:hypothetical protein
MAAIVNTAMSNKADAAALAAAAAQTPQSNSEAMAEAFFDRCREWGEKAGAGDTSKVGMILDVARSAWDENSPVCPGLGPTGYATRAYDAHRNAKMAKAGEMGKRFGGDDKSRAQRVSEINKYLKVGALPLIRDTDMGGYGVLKRTVKLIKDREDIKGEVEDLLSKVATAQLQSPAVPLPDDRIIEVMTGSAKTKLELSDEEAEAARWANVIVQIDAIRAKFTNEPGNSVVRAKDDSNIAQARDAIGNRIHALGGTRAQKLADIKKAEAAQKKLNGKGKRRRK